MIIHHVYKYKGSWIMCYEYRGEWKPRNVKLNDFIDLQNKLDKR